jgi:hypothetical protein
MVLLHLYLDHLNVNKMNDWMNEYLCIIDILLKQDLMKSIFKMYEFYTAQVLLFSILM